MEDFEDRLGWLPVARVIAEIVRPVAGDDAGEQIETAIRHKELRARCIADGVTRDFEPQWLDFVIQSEGVGSEVYLSDDKICFREGAGGKPHQLLERKTLYFDGHKAHEAGAAVPHSVSKIIVSSEDCARLWHSGPFPHWDNPAWDHPVRLLDAIRLWSPAIASRLDETKRVSPDEIRDIARRLRDYDHPTRVHARRARAKQKRDRDPNSKFAREASRDALDATAVRGLPEPLRDDWARLQQEWDQWDDGERLIHSVELAGRLIIEKTKRGQPHILAYKPPAPDGSLYIDYARVGEASRDALSPLDFDISNSTISGPGGRRLPARILGGIEAEGERARSVRFAREARDAAAAAIWSGECSKPMRDRQYFRCGDIAAALATNPESLEIDVAKRDRIVRDLADWTSRGEFDLSGDPEVVILSGEPPYFLQLGTIGPDSILFANPDELILRGNACRRYLQNSSLQGAPRLLRNWFSETELHRPKGDKNLPNTGEPKPDKPPALATAVSANVMPPDGAERYTLLWDAAAEMARSNGQTLERNWLRLMDAFWRGDLAPSGLTYFYPGHEGREFFVYERMTLAGMLLGHRALDIGKNSIDNLRHWRLDDYRNPPDGFPDFFQRDPQGCIGLAVLTKALDRWREGSGEPVSPNTIPSEGRAPPDGMRPAVDPGLRDAIENALKKQGTPGKTVPWKTFCDYVRSICGVGSNRRGYGDKSVMRAVRAIKAERDKKDKSDLSEMS